MPTYKTAVELATIDTFISEHFGQDVIDFKMIAGGELSQAGIVETASGTKVIRFSKHGDEAYHKDKFAYEHFKGLLVPIPAVEEIGKLSDGMFYAVSELARGMTLDKLSPNELKDTLPSMIATMDAIHQTAPISNGFGPLRLDGTGKASSWHDALDRNQASDDEDMLDSIPMFEREIYDRFRVKIKEYYQYCPKGSRQLIHGDFGLIIRWLKMAKLQALLTGITWLMAIHYTMLPGRTSGHQRVAGRLK